MRHVALGGMAAWTRGPQGAERYNPHTARFVPSLRSMNPSAIDLRPRSGFVTALAWTSLALGVLGTASGLLQAISLPLVQPETFLQGFEQNGPALPAALTWTFAHLQAINAMSTVLSALFAWVSWGLLRRREWARLAFIAFLVLGALAGFAGVALVRHLLGWMAGLGALEADPALAGIVLATQVAMIGAAVLIALLHAAIAWKLCTRAIRAEFAPSLQ